MGTLDATAEEGDRDLGKTLGVAFTIICFLGLLAVMLMCLSGKGRLSFYFNSSSSFVQRRVQLILFVCLFGLYTKETIFEIWGVKQI